MPTAGARTHPELPAGRGQTGALVSVGVVGLVTPAQRDRVLGDLIDHLGVLKDDVAPEQHLPVAVRDEAVDLAQEVQIDGRLAALGAGFRRAAATQVERLVQADVEATAHKLRQQLVVEAAEELDNPRIGRAQAERFGVDGEGVAEPFGHLRQRAVPVMDEPAVEMAEAVLVRGQFDESLAAVGVERADLGGGEGGGVAPDILVAFVGVGVLDVELEVVDLPLRQTVDQTLQVRHRGHPVPAHVQHRAADREIGPILDLDRRDLEPAGGLPSVRGEPLPQRRGGSEQADRCCGFNRDAVAVDPQAVALVRGNGGSRFAYGGGGVDGDPAGDVGSVPGGVAFGIRNDQLPFDARQSSSQTGNREPQFLRDWVLVRRASRPGDREPNRRARGDDQGRGGVRFLDPPRRRPETHRQPVRRRPPGCSRRSGLCAGRRRRCRRSTPGGRLPARRLVAVRRRSGGTAPSSCRS